MSLTRQIKDKNSPVRRFFTKFENKEGAKECLALLQSTKSIRQLQFTPASIVVFSFIGTATDYLIRYAANGNSLTFENTIANKALGYADTKKCSPQYLESLYEIGKQYLDGRDATDYKAVYSATALAMMDNVYRSGLLPKLFSESVPREKTTRLLFDEYYESLGGKLYAQDVSELVETFVAGTKNQESELFNAKFVVFNKAFKNSRLVGGADFDCIIEYNDRMILIDIKTITEPLSIYHLHEIIGYALLYDAEKDDFKFTDIGIYHSRSGSFRFLPIDQVIEKSLSSFKSVSQAREAFISEIKKP